MYGNISDMKRETLEERVADVRGEMAYLEDITIHQKERMRELRDHKEVVRADLEGIERVIARTCRVGDLRRWLPIYICPGENTLPMTVHETGDLDADRDAMQHMSRDELEDTLTELMVEAGRLKDLEEEQENYLEELAEEVRDIGSDMVAIEDAIECSGSMAELMSNMPESFLERNL